MKRFFSAATMIAMALALGATAFAQCGIDGGCGNCNQAQQMAGLGSPAAKETNVYRQFRNDTLDLRQEMMNKRFELQRENLKGTPDGAKVAALKADIASIQSKINEVRVKSGLSDDGKRDGECFKADGGCNMQNGQGGCNGQPCWQK
jgi:Spy/CpxP family protein refolding chaperone